MKLAMFLFAVLLVSTQVFAGQDPLTLGLTKAINARLAQVNPRLSQQGEELYCPEMSAEQMNYIESILVEGYSEPGHVAQYRDLMRVSVDKFVEKVADQLVCYPLACPQQARASLGGVICNGKAFRRDRALLQDSLSQISGKKLNGNESAGYILEQLKQ